MPEIQSHKNVNHPSLRKRRRKTLCKDSFGHSAVPVKDGSENHETEQAVNREIATLLLSLHASQERKEWFANENGLKLDCNLSGDVERPIDLTCHPSALAAATSLVKEGRSSNGGYDNISHTKGNLIPKENVSDGPISLPVNNSSLSQNYILQNLLLGKMQQMANLPKIEMSEVMGAPSCTNERPSNLNNHCGFTNGLRFPTHPLPAKTLLMIENLEKPPPSSVLNSALPVEYSNITQKCSRDASETKNNAQSTRLTNLNGSQNIPILCGQIVAQLNGILFLVHSLKSPDSEKSLQSELFGIYRNLQDMVAGIEKAQMKSQNVATVTETSKSGYSTKISSKSFLPLGIRKQTEGKVDFCTETPFCVDLDTRVHGDDSDRISDGDKQSPKKSKRRRGRPPKSSTGTSNPPQKRTRGTLHSPSSTASNEPATNKKKSNGKGIRNRVFCGECNGCLKNDDCGKCRYCRDKTKFGGQNRLRQKCLHRRCQMDSQRRRSSNSQICPHSSQICPQSKTNNETRQMGIKCSGHSTLFHGASSDPEKSHKLCNRSSLTEASQIYCGVDLAKLAVSTISSSFKEEQNEAYHKPLPPKPTLGEDPSDDDSEDHIRQNKSRSNIWKAKHEAMLRKAAWSKSEMNII